MNLFLAGDARAALATLPAASVHCVVTSPPYYGIRDYGVAPSVWSDGWTGCLGLEETPEAFVAHMVESFAAVARVLRPDGTLWLNLGDSYAGSGRGGHPGGASGIDGSVHGPNNARDAQRRMGFRAPEGHKDKDLLGIPWMVAFGLRAAGWYLRSDIVWAKPNPLPESVRDRPTRAHEYLFLFAHPESRGRYFYDATAIAEEAVGQPAGYSGSATRNARDVWTITPKPFKGAHFAVMPPDLATRCVKAGTSEHGACSVCGAPWARVLAKTGVIEDRGSRRKHADVMLRQGQTGALATGQHAQSVTIGWRPTCDHPDAPRVPAVTLDPFSGAGTVALVSQRLGRSSIYVDAKPEYRDIAVERLYGPP